MSYKGLCAVSQHVINIVIIIRPINGNLFEGEFFYGFVRAGRHCLCYAGTRLNGHRVNGFPILDFNYLTVQIPIFNNRRSVLTANIPTGSVNKVVGKNLNKTFGSVFKFENCSETVINLVICYVGQS